MGSYTFKWDNPAEDVYVTGTFDNWSKSIKLDKEGEVFQKTVDFKEPAPKVYYKYVVDNNWTVNDSSPKEPDHEGNINNFLTHADYKSTTSAVEPPVSAAVLNTVTPQSTTAQLAGEQPIEKKDSYKEASSTPAVDDIPGGFPATPANEIDQPIGVNPLPAADGAINPIQLAPGEPVPNDVKIQGLHDQVRLDKESYEKADTLAGVDVNVPPPSKTTIPETGFAVASDDKSNVNDPIIATVGAGATTAALAGSISKEPKQAKVPEIVKESQEKANVPAEASAVPEEVAEKVKVEDELKEKVSEIPATSTGTAGFGTEKMAETGTIAATAAAAGGAITAAAVYAKETFDEKAGPSLQKATETVNQNLPDGVKDKLPVSVQDTLSGQSKEATREEVSPDIPEEVKQSIIEANTEPEAAANTSAVHEKKAVEAELRNEVDEVPAVDEIPAKGAVTVEGPAKAAEVAPVNTDDKKTLDTTAEAPITANEPVTASSSVPAHGSTTVTSSAPANGSASANGHGSGPAKSSTPSVATADKKKKNRLSSMFTKIKEKLSDKK